MTAAYSFRFTRSADGYAVGYLPTLDSIAAGDATAADGRHLGTVRRLSQEWQSLSPKWQATAPDGTNLGTHYRTRAEAAQALLVTSDRLREVEAIADAAEPAEVVEPAPVVEVEVPEYLRPALDAYGEAIAAHGQTYGATPACECGAPFRTRNGVGLHVAAAHKRAEREYAAAAAIARHKINGAAVVAEAAARLAAPVEAPAVRISTREELIARQIANGVSPERAAMVADARDALQAEITRNAPAIAAALDEPAVDGTDGLVHLMSDALLDACGTAGPGGLHLAPETTPERITCPACRRLVEEADLPPTEEERVTVRIRTRELCPGDVIVDGAGREVYHAFDVQIDDEGAAKVWTAIRDQEAGLPPVVHLHRDREVLVLRPVSEEGRELLAALDRATEPEFGSPAWALSLLPENRRV
jgi:hypothetical protein